MIDYDINIQKNKLNVNCDKYIMKVKNQEHLYQKEIGERLIKIDTKYYYVFKVKNE